MVIFKYNPMHQVEKDETVLKQRQELARAKSPSELAEMRGLSDFPVPTFVQDLSNKAMSISPSTGGGTDRLANCRVF